MSFLSSQGGTQQNEKTEKDMRKKSQDILCSEKTSFPVLFALDLGNITPYCLVF